MSEHLLWELENQSLITRWEVAWGEEVNKEWVWFEDYKTITYFLTDKSSVTFKIQNNE